MTIRGIEWTLLCEDGLHQHQRLSPHHLFAFLSQPQMAQMKCEYVMMQFSLKSHLLPAPLSEVLPQDVIIMANHNHIIIMLDRDERIPRKSYIHITAQHNVGN